MVQSKNPVSQNYLALGKFPAYVHGLAYVSPLSPAAQLSALSRQQGALAYGAYSSLDHPGTLSHCSMTQQGRESNGEKVS